ncbi:MAG TPA: OsmC family protein [Acidimicrobiales bacterium]
MTLPTTSPVVERHARLQALYRRAPTEAMIRKHVWTRDGEVADPAHGAVVPGAHGTTWAVGIDAKVGGDDDAPNPGEMLCAALASCLDTTLRMIANHLRVELRSVRVDVQGEVDARGALAVDPGVRVGFQALNAVIAYDAAPGTEPRRLELLRAQTDQLCITLDTLRNGVAVDVAWAG